MHIGTDRKNSHIAILAIVLFITFDFVALGLNFWLSWKIEQQAIAINLSGRQRMLSQRMVKVLLQVDNAHRSGHDATEQLKELQLTFNLFDDTLQGFDIGHKTIGGADEVLLLPAVQGGGARAAVDEAVILWLPYREHMLRVLAAGSLVTTDVLQPAIAHAEKVNLNLLMLMNKLTTELEQQTQEEARHIRIYQTAAFVLALANFFLAFVVYMRRIREFSQNHNLLDDIINKISASVLVLDQRNVVLKANQMAGRMFGYGSNLIGMNIEALLKIKEDDLLGHRKDGSTFIARSEKSPTILDERELYIVTVLDITQQRMTEDHLSSLAYQDLLTKLPNRLLFDDRLYQGISQSQRRNLVMAVLFIDLDDFKPVNDTYGHEVGDLLLQDVAVRLTGCLRESDTVSRRGGDEFTIIIMDIGNVQYCEKVAQIVLAQLSRPFHIHDLKIHISCSIGIAFFQRMAMRQIYSLVVQMKRCIVLNKQDVLLIAFISQPFSH